ncbi:MAG: Rrf2 family transcriptional regulator [Trueperaceae bacterium]
MRLSATDVYALQALGYLGHRYGGGWVGSDAVSESTSIPRPYLARVLASLVASGILASKKGAGGGYALARDPAEVDLREVIRAIDGPVAPLSCISRNWYQPCEVEDRCHARGAVWERVRDAVLDALAQVSVADLARDFDQGLDYRPCLDHLLRPGA